MSALADTHVPPAALSSDWLSGAERALRLVVEVPAAILVAAEALILFAGIVSRAIGHSIIWSDELASILFLWLAMLGSVVAVQRGEHMRLTFVVGALSPRARAWCESWGKTVVQVPVEDSAATAAAASSRSTPGCGVILKQARMSESSGT